MYKLESNKKDYISTTKRKYFKFALDYVLKNSDKIINNDEKITICCVNKINYIFDFNNLIVSIKSNKDNKYSKHRLLEV